MVTKPWRLREVGPASGGWQPGSLCGQHWGGPAVRCGLSQGHWAPRLCGPVCASFPSLAFRFSPNLVECLWARHRLPQASVFLGVLWKPGLDGLPLLPPFPGAPDPPRSLASRVSPLRRGFWSGYAGFGSPLSTDKPPPCLFIRMRGDACGQRDARCAGSPPGVGQGLRGSGPVSLFLSTAEGWMESPEFL